MRILQTALLRLIALLATLALCEADPVATKTPAATSPNTYILVHGAWGGGWAFKTVDRLLSADGSTVHRPTLTGLGEKHHLAQPEVGLDTHITDIVNLILWEDLHDVVLMGHSYGGMVITGVIDRVPDRIKRAVYLDAILPENGENVQGDRPPTAFKIENGFIIPPWVTDPLSPPPHDVPHPVKTFTDPIVLRQPAAAAQIPTTYILTVDEGHAPADDQFFRFYERAKARKWETVVMTGDHNVQWSRPEELARLIRTSSGRATRPRE